MNLYWHFRPNRVRPGNRRRFWSQNLHFPILGLVAPWKYLNGFALWHLPDINGLAPLGIRIHDHVSQIWIEISASWSEIPVQSRVPQSSVLGPLLLNLFVLVDQTIVLQDPLIVQFVGVCWWMKTKMKMWHNLFTATLLARCPWIECNHPYPWTCSVWWLCAMTVSMTVGEWSSLWCGWASTSEAFSRGGSRYNSSLMGHLRQGCSFTSCITQKKGQKVCILKFTVIYCDF